MQKNTGEVKYITMTCPEIQMTTSLSLFSVSQAHMSTLVKSILFTQPKITNVTQVDLLDVQHVTLSGSLNPAQSHRAILTQCTCLRQNRPLGWRVHSGLV